MELGIPLAVILGACIAAYFASRGYKSKYKHPIARFLDHLCHAGFSIASGLILYPDVSRVLDWQNRDVLIVMLITMTIDEVSKLVKSYAKNKDRLRELIHTLTKK